MFCSCQSFQRDPIMLMLFFCVFFVELGPFGLFVAALPLSVSTGKGLVFPDDSQDGLYGSTPPKCHNKTFCEDLDHYPSQLFNNILHSPFYLSRYDQFFQHFKESESTLATRIIEEELDLCPSSRSIVYPKAAYNTRKVLRFIYNLESYRQGVVVDVCVAKSTFGYYKRVRNFRTFCTQTYAKKLMLTADENGRPYVDFYRFPAACVGEYTERNSVSKFRVINT